MNPTHVGMNRYNQSGDKASQNEPHARGDEPALIDAITVPDA